MKRILLVLVVLTMILSACGKSSKVTESTVNNEGPESNIVPDDEEDFRDNDSRKGEENQNEGVDVDEEPYGKTEENYSNDVNDENRYNEFSLIHTGTFQNGYTWILFQDTDGNEYTGWLDKNGNLQYYSDSLYTSNTIFDAGFLENGKAYAAPYQLGGRVISIDTKSNIEDVDQTNDTRTVRLSGEYNVMADSVSGFDTNKIVYQIYDSDYNKIEEFETDGDVVTNVAYLGNGIIDFSGDLFFAKSGKWLKDTAILDWQTLSNPKYRNNSYIISFVGDGYGYDDAWMTLCDNEGNYKDITIPEEYFPEGYDTSPVLIDSSENYILLSNLYAGINSFYFGDLILYDVKENVFTRFNTQYDDQIEWFLNYHIPNYSVASCGTNTLAVELEGKDGETYTGLFNIKTKELVCEPIHGNCSGIVNDKLVVKDSSKTRIYDSDGKMLEEFDGDYDLVYSDNSYTIRSSISGENNVWCYDEKWNLLFKSDDIDFSVGKYFTLQ